MVNPNVLDKGRGCSNRLLKASDLVKCLDHTLKTDEPENKNHEKILIVSQTGFSQIFP